MPTEIQKFIDWINRAYGLNIRHHGDLELLNQNDKAVYWKAIWDNFNIIASKEYRDVLTKDGEWFTESELNYTEHIFRQKDTTKPALLFSSETFEGIPISWEELETQTASFADYLNYLKIKKGDIVAGCLSSIPEVLFALFACNSIGAIWVNVSPLLDAKSLINHLQQLEPKVLIANELVQFDEKEYNNVDKIDVLVENLPHLQQVVVIPSQQAAKNSKKIKSSKYWNDTFSMAAPALSFEPLSFDFPLYISFSKKSDSTFPQPIYHQQGATLLDAFDNLVLKNNFNRSNTIIENPPIGLPLLIGSTTVFFDGSEDSALFANMKGEKIMEYSKRKGELFLGV